MRKSSWEVLHAKAVEDKFEKSLETNSSRLVVRYVFVNGLVKRWRESLGDRSAEIKPLLSDLFFISF